jgi:hypothetical protein
MRQFAKYEKFDPKNEQHVKSLKNHKDYEPGLIIDERKLVFRPPTEKDMASDKYKKAQEICEKEIKIET